MNHSSSSKTHWLLFHQQPATFGYFVEPFCESPYLSLQWGTWRNLRLKQVIRLIITVFLPIKQISHVYAENKHYRLKVSKLPVRFSFSLYFIWVNWVSPIKPFRQSFLNYYMLLTAPWRHIHWQKYRWLWSTSLNWTNVMSSH